MICETTLYQPSLNSLTMIRLSISITALAVIVGSSSIVLSNGCAARVFAMQGAQEHSSGEAPAQATTFEIMADAKKGFNSALNQMCAGNAVPMDSVWAHTTDVSDFGPDGKMHVGWEAGRVQFQKEAAMSSAELSPMRVCTRS
jgi:hypothetical protein